MTTAAAPLTPSSARWRSRAIAAAKVIGAFVLGFLVLRGLLSIAQQWRSQPTPPPAVAVAPALPTPATRTPAERLQRARSLLAGIPMQSSASVRDVFESSTGMTGMVIETPQGPLVAWMPEQHEVLIIGAVFDRSGRNLSQQTMIERGFAAAADTPMASRGSADADGKLLRSLQSAAGTTEGRSGPLVFAFVDPKCVYCSHLWRLARQPIAEGRIRVRWLPVGVLGEASLQLAGAVLQAPDPLAALNRLEAGQGAAVAPPISAATREALLANEALLRLLTAGRVVTPLLVARGAQGPIVSPGLPPDLSAWIKEAR